MFLQRRRDHSLHSGYTETAVKLSFVLSFFHKLLLTKKNCFFSHLLLFAYTSKMSFLCRLQLIKNNLEHSVKFKKKKVLIKCSLLNVPSRLWLCAWPSHSYSLWLFVDTRGRQLSLFHHFSLFGVTLHLFLIIFTLFTLIGASASVNISPHFGHFEAFCAHLFSVFSVPGLLDFLCPWVCILFSHPFLCWNIPSSDLFGTCWNEQN